MLAALTSLVYLCADSPATCFVPSEGLGSRREIRILNFSLVKKVVLCPEHNCYKNYFLELQTLFYSLALYIYLMNSLQTYGMVSFVYI